MSTRVYTKGVTTKSHGGNEYVVFRCDSPELVRRAVANASFILRCWEVNRGASYDIRKLVTSSLLGRRGECINDEKIRQEMTKLQGQRNSWFKTNRTNFLCSHFVAYVYMWAAHDLAKAHPLGDIDELFGIPQSRISPAELCVRMLRYRHFRIVGELLIG